MNLPDHRPEEHQQQATASPDQAKRLEDERERRGKPEPDIEEERDQPAAPRLELVRRPSEVADREPDESTI